jgi:hypothetical protein
MNTNTIAKTKDRNPKPMPNGPKVNALNMPLIMNRGKATAIAMAAMIRKMKPRTAFLMMLSSL